MLYRPSSPIQSESFISRTSTSAHDAIRYDSAPVVTNLANWMSSGLYITTPPAFLKFYYRTFCQMAHHFGRQAPHGSTLSVDYKKLSECFTLTEENGVEHQPEFWQLHPGSEAASERFGCTREESVKRWEEHKERHGKLMPSVVHAQQLGKRLRTSRYIFSLTRSHSGKEGHFCERFNKQDQASDQA